MNVHWIIRNNISNTTDKAKKEIYRNKLEEGQDDPSTIWYIFKQFGACRKFSFRFGMLLYVLVNSYGHVGMVSLPNHTIFLTNS